MCCWQATEKGLCFDVEQYDYCHLGYEAESSDDDEYEEEEE
jgi:hypothetical protein